MARPLYNRRVRILSVALLLVGALFVIRLFYLQVVRHDYYLTKANAEQVKTLTIPATRGEIYLQDNGTPVKVVLNEAVYTAVADPLIVDEDAEVATTIRRVAGGNVADNIEELLAKKDTRYQILARNLTRKQAEEIKEKGFSGILFQQTSRRVYPEGTLASQTLGFVNADTQGQYGIEGALNDRLNGVDGTLKSVTDVANVPLTIGDDNVEIPARNGDDIVLTIDRTIQAKVEDVLKNTLKDIPNKSVVVMNPRNGQIVAMANYPTYNPAEYSKVSDGALFNNAIISSPYEPGSSLKTFTVATGIDTGKITRNSTFYNTDSVRIGDWTIGNATKGQTGTITMQHALNYSLNTGMVDVLEQLGDGSINAQARTTLYRYLHDKFRLGQSTGIELTGESDGTVIPPTVTEGNAIRYANMTFGQGLDVTMLQVASGFCSIVNGGTYYQPSIVAGTMVNGSMVQAAQKSTTENVISAKTSATARSMIHDARTAFYAGNDKKGFYIGGKTGTSETLTTEGYTKNTTIATYLGFGGASGELPQYVIMVRSSGDDMNLQGNYHAMPIFTEISNWLLEYYKLQPKG